jgi:mannose/fructose-specific phosphotransferase system component IIA
MAATRSGEAQVGLVIVTHAGCGDCLLAAAAGDRRVPCRRRPPSVVMPSEPFEDIVRRVGRACDQVDSGVGLLILADVHGSSPFRACLAMVDGTRPVEIVAGVNLPMLIKLATCDRSGLRPVEVAELVKEVGKRSIRLGSELTGKFSIPREDHH